MHLTVLLRDKAGRSIPAPGRGALTIARQVPSKHPLPILDLAYRSRQLSFRRSQISHWLSHEQQQLNDEMEFQKRSGEEVDEEYFSSRIVAIEKEAAQQEKDALAMYGMLEGNDPRIAPLRRALAVWGLTVDDIGVLSIHGTSTNANVGIKIYFSSEELTTIHRKRMRHISGTKFSLHCLAPLATPYQSWLKRVYLATQKEALLPGKCLVFCKPLELALFQATEIASMYLVWIFLLCVDLHPATLILISKTAISSCSLPRQSIQMVSVLVLW